MAKISVGDVFWNLRANGAELPADVKKAIVSSKKQLERTGGAFKSAGKKITAGLTLPILGIGVASAKIAADFDNSMREVNSLIGLPQKGFQDLKDEIRSTTKVLGIELQDGAAASYQAISAGIPREELSEFLKQAGKASIAGVSDLETSVGLLTKSMDAYGDKSVDVATLSDQLFATVKGGVTTFGELAQALPNATGLAAGLGVESAELLGILARTTKVSESTSGAVTRISAAMGALIKPSGDMEKLLKKAGIANVKAAIEADGFTDTLIKLRTAAKGNDTVLAKAFGRKEAILLMQDLALNTEAWREQIDATTNSAGSLESAYSEIDKSPGRSLAKLKASFASLAEQIGTVLLPAILPVIDKVTQWVSGLGDLDPWMLKTGVAVAGVAAAIGPLLGGIGFIISGMGALLPIITGVAGGAGGLAGVFGAVAGILTGPVVLAVGAIIAAGAFLITHWEEVKSMASSFAQFVGDAFQGWKERNAGVFAQVGESWDHIKAKGAQLWAAIVSGVQKTITWLDDFLTPINGLEGAWTILKETVALQWDLMTSIIGNAFKAISVTFGFLVDTVTGQSEVWKNLGGWIFDAWDSIKTTVNAGITAVVDFFVKTDWKQLGIDIIRGIANGIKGAAKLAVNAAADAAGAIKTKFKNFFGIKSPATVMIAMGKFIMQGLGIGISSDKSAVKAGETAAQKVKSSFSKGLLGLGLGAGLVAGPAAANPLDGLADQDKFSQDGFGSIVDQYTPEVDKIQAKFQSEREAILAETQITDEQRTALLQSNETARNEALLNQRGGFFQGLIALEQSNNTTLSAIGKAATIAQFAFNKKAAIQQAFIDTKAAATKALAAFPPPANFLAAGVVAAAGAANIASMISSNFQGGFENGGDFVSGRPMLVGEGGPELMVPRGQGRVLTNSESFGANSSSGTSNIEIVVNNNGAPMNATVKETSTSKGRRFEIELEQTEKYLAQQVDRGRGPLAQVLDNHGATKRGGRR